MAYIQFDIDSVVATRAAATSSLILETGELQSLTLTCQTPAIEPCQNYAQIGFIAAGSVDNAPFAVLAHGYLGQGSPLSWTGKLTLLPGYKIFARVYSSAAAIFRLSAMTNKT